MFVQNVLHKLVLSYLKSFHNKQRFEENCLLNSCRSCQWLQCNPNVRANKLYFTLPLGFPWQVHPAVTQGRLDPISAGGCAHHPTTTAHYWETLVGIRRVWRRMRRWADRNRGFALTQFAPFPDVSFTADPLLLCQPWRTLTLPGPLGHSRSKTYLSFQDLIRWKTPCGTHSSHSCNRKV